MNLLKNPWLAWFFNFSIITCLFYPLPIEKTSTADIFILNNNDIFQFNSTNAYTIIENQLDFGFRIPGTEASKYCGNYYITYIRSISPSPSIFQDNFSVNAIECRNLLIKINPNNSHIIILGAHYDSRAISEKDPIASKRIEPCPGANDGASGVAVLLELYRIFYEKRESLNCSLWICLFDAEDQGSGGMPGWDWCEGSEKFTDRMSNYYNPEIQSIDAMILLDMVGGINLQFINEMNSNGQLLSELFEIGRSLGYLDAFPSDPVSNTIIDDHLSFQELGIPSADLIIDFGSKSASWSYHHTTSDNITYISQESLEITGRTIEKFIYNHYLNSPEYEKDIGNYPWRDIDGNLNLETVIYIVSFILLITIAIVLIINITRKKNGQEIKIR